ncbi:MAG: ABC transporter ATP-binding protein [Acidimicrobiales bacterium]
MSSTDAHLPVPAPSPPAPPPVDPDPIGRLERTLRPSRADLAKLLLLGLFRGGTAVANILLVRRIVDAFVAGSPLSRVVPVIAWFGLVAVIQAISRGLEYSVTEKIGYRVVARLRMVLHDHLLRLPARRVQRSSQGAILLRFTGDLSTYRTWISRGLGRGVVALFTLTVALAVVAWFNLLMAATIIGVGLTGAAAAILAGYQVHRTTRAVRWRRSLLASNVAEQIRSLDVVQAFGRARGEASRLDHQNTDLLGALSRAANARGALRVISSATAYLALAAVLLVGAVELDRQRITVGDVVAALTAVRLMTGPAQTLGRAYEYRQAAQVSKKKLGDYMARTERRSNDDLLPPLRPRRGGIELTDVRVPGALDGITLTLAPERQTAVMGPNGAGKSALLSVLWGNIAPEHGRVRIDGQDLAEVNLRSIVRNIGLVSTDLPLMRGTVRRNIGYRYGKADDEHLVHAIVATSLGPVLADLDGGLDFWVVEGGTNLPEGYRFRIALARALVGNPRVLLLDYPTQALDPESRTVFHEFLHHYRGTVVLVTQDPQEAMLADRVITLDRGRVTGDTAAGPPSPSMGRPTRIGQPAW